MSDFQRLLEYNFAVPRTTIKFIDIMLEKNLNAKNIPYLFNKKHFN